MWYKSCEAPPPRTVFPGIPIGIGQGIPGKTGPWERGKVSIRVGGENEEDKLDKTMMSR